MIGSKVEAEMLAASGVRSNHDVVNALRLHFIDTLWGKGVEVPIGRGFRGRKDRQHLQAPEVSFALFG